MNITNQVVSVTLSRKLKKLGYPQEGLGKWIFNTYTNKWEIMKSKYISTDECIAPTVSELGRQIPRGDHSFTKDRDNGMWTFWIHISSVTASGTARTEANARAKALIWLVENGYLTFKK